MNPERTARFVRKWFSEWEPEPPIFGRATQILNYLVDENPDKAWDRILALIANSRPESLGFVAAGPLEDLISKHGAVMIDRIEALAASDSRFFSCVAGVWGHTRFEPSIYSRIQEIIQKSPK